MRAYLDAGGDPDLSSQADNTLLMEASHYKQVAISRLLLQSGADPNAHNHSFHTPLTFALKKPSTLPPVVMTPAGAVGFPAMPDEARDRSAMVAQVHLLIEFGADINPSIPIDEVTLRTRDGFKTPLQQAIEIGDLTLVQWLLSHGANIDGGDANGTTPLATAVREGQIRLAQLLIEAGASPHLRDLHGQTPLHRLLARLRDDLGAFRYQSTRRGPPPSRTAPTRLVALWTALMRQLVEAGADPNAVDVNGDSVLDLALTTGSPKVVEPLIALGADPKALHRNGDTALHRVAAASNLHEHETLEIARLLVTAGLSAQLTNRSHQTASALALAAGREELARWLDLQP